MTTRGINLTEEVLPLTFDAIAVLVSIPLLVVAPRAKWEKDGKPDKHSTRLLIASIFLFFVASIFDLADFAIGLRRTLNPFYELSESTTLGIVAMDIIWAYASHGTLGWLILRITNNFLESRIRSSSDDERIKFRRIIMMSGFVTYGIFLVLQVVSFATQMAMDVYIENDNFTEYEKLYIPNVSIALTLNLVYIIFVFIITMSIIPILPTMRSHGHGATIFLFLAALGFISLLNIMSAVDEADNISVWTSEQHSYNVSAVEINSNEVLFAVTQGLGTFFATMLNVALVAMSLRPPYGYVLRDAEESNKRGWSSGEDTGYFSQQERYNSDAKAAPQELDAHDAPAELTTETPLRELEGDTNGGSLAQTKARAPRGSANSHPAYRHGESRTIPETQPLSSSARPNNTGNSGSFSNLKDAFRRAAGLRKPAWNRQSQMMGQQID